MEENNTTFDEQPIRRPRITITISVRKIVED